MAETGKCGHDACGCPAPEGGSYCSDHCREAHDQDIVEIACDCGCPGCGG